GRDDGQTGPRDKQREEGQAGNRVQHARDPGDWPIDAWLAGRPNAKGQRQKEADGHSQPGQHQVLANAMADVAQMAEDPIPANERLAGGHEPAGTFWSMASRSAVAIISTVTTPANRPASS